MARRKADAQVLRRQVRVSSGEQVSPEMVAETLAVGELARVQGGLGISR